MPSGSWSSTAPSPTTPIRIDSVAWLPKINPNTTRNISGNRNVKKIVMRSRKKPRSMAMVSVPSCPSREIFAAGASVASTPVSIIRGRPGR